MPQKANSSSYAESRPPFRIADSWRTQLPERTAAELERYVNRGPAGLSGFLYRLLSATPSGRPVSPTTRTGRVGGAAGPDRPGLSR